MFIAFPRSGSCFLLPKTCHKFIGSFAKIRNKVKANQIRGREFPVGLDNINCITHFWQNQSLFTHFSIVISVKFLSYFCRIWYFSPFFDNFLHGRTVFRIVIIGRFCSKCGNNFPSLCPYISIMTTQISLFILVVALSL